jgi:hypothetical protein
VVNNENSSSSGSSSDSAWVLCAVTMASAIASSGSPCIQTLVCAHEQHACTWHINTGNTQRDVYTQYIYCSMLVCVLSVVVSLRQHSTMILKDCIEQMNRTNFKPVAMTEHSTWVVSFMNCSVQRYEDVQIVCTHWICKHNACTNAVYASPVLNTMSV